MSHATTACTTAREPDGSRAVRTAALSKSYGGGDPVVDRIDLAVPYRAIYGFLGPNGSGKTTTIRMLLGLIEPTAGHCELLGRPIPEAAARVLPQVGALVDGPAFHADLSGRDNLRRLDATDITADKATVDERIVAALERVGLNSAARRRFRTYSLGMKQRLAIAAALLRPRRLLILDEPTNGLDPQGTREMRALITALAAEGLTVLLSTHLLSEVAQLCSHAGVMYRGRLAAQGSLPELLSIRERRVRVDSATPSAVAEVVQRLGMRGIEVDETGLTARPGEIEPEKIVASIAAEGIGIRGFQVVEPSLEEVFISLTGEGFDVGR